MTLVNILAGVDALLKDMTEFDLDADVSQDWKGLFESLTATSPLAWYGYGGYREQFGEFGGAKLEYWNIDVEFYIDVATKDEATISTEINALADSFVEAVRTNPTLPVSGTASCLVARVASGQRPRNLRYNNRPFRWLVFSLEAKENVL